MAITHKSTVLVPQEFRQHVLNVSKAALIDLVWDMLVKSHGEDQMGTGIALFNEAFEPVASVRGDKVPKIAKGAE